jgi:hypothetical protein
MTTLVSPSTDAVKTVPDIIKAASSSPLGILALIIVILGVLAYVYFKDAPVNTRVAIFAGLLLGAVLYAVAISKAVQANSPGAVAPQPSQPIGITSVDGIVADADGGKSINLATITTVLSTSPAITDTNGIFHLKIKTPDAGDSVVLHVSKEGYESLDWTVTPPLSGGIRILLTKGPSAAQSGPSVVTSETYRSDNAASGACKDFGAWTSVCSADKPDGWTIAAQNFSLIGDRAGCAYAECGLVSPPTATKVCYHFRTQGHDEECGHSGNTGIHYSQGVLNIVWQHH